MNDELRRKLDRAAGDEPKVDLTETVWARGRVVRRRRHAAQAVGGLAAAAVLVGAFALGGGILTEPNSYDGPARPTLDDTATSTSMLVRTEEVTPDPTTASPEKPSSADPTRVSSTGDEPVAADTPAPAEDTTDPSTADESVEPTADETGGAEAPAPDGLALTSTSIGGVPLSSPTADLVAVISADFGEPFSSEVDAVGGCSGNEIYSLYNWDGFTLWVRGAEGPDAVRSWETRSTEVALPHGVRIGMALDEVRALDTVTELPSVASPRYQLGSGLEIHTDPDGVVSSAANKPGEVC